jgi:hypothetical protein
MALTISTTTAVTTLATTTVAPRKRPIVGERVELARYTAAGAKRVLYGQRIDGIVRVTDRPATGAGRSYLVERELHRKAELDALSADYLHQAGQHDAIPMSTSVLGHQSLLEAA